MYINLSLSFECKLLPTGLTLRLNGKKIIPKDGEVHITDLPVGGCRRYDTLECLSDVPYRGRVEKAYWKYTDLDLKDREVDDIRCKGKDCWKFGWHSNLGIYKKGKKYFGVVRLGRRFENATTGIFTCHFEGDSDSPVSVNISELTSYHELYAYSIASLSNLNILWPLLCISDCILYPTMDSTGSCNASISNMEPQN